MAALAKKIPAVTTVDAKPYVAELESRSTSITKAFEESRRARLSLVKQFASGTFTDRMSLVRPGELFSMRRLEAIWHYLYFAAIPQSTTQVHDACERGAIRTTAQDTLKATQSSLQYGMKRGRFLRVGRATNGESLWVIAPPTGKGHTT